MRPPGAEAKDGEGGKAMLWRWLPLGLSLGWPEKLREMNCYWPHRRVTGARTFMCGLSATLERGSPMSLTSSVRPGGTSVGVFFGGEDVV